MPGLCSFNELLSQYLHSCSTFEFIHIKSLHHCHLTPSSTRVSTDEAENVTIIMNGREGNGLKDSGIELDDFSVACIVYSIAAGPFEDARLRVMC